MTSYPIKSIILWTNAPSSFPSSGAVAKHFTTTANTFNSAVAKESESNIFEPTLPGSFSADFFGVPSGVAWGVEALYGQNKFL